MEVRIGPWRCEVDVEATSAAYRSTRRGSPADCLCDGCASFARRVEEAYPPAFRGWLEEAGADALRAAEIHECASGPGGAVFYSGWFHLAGTVVEGPAGEDGGWHEVEPWFSVRVDTRRDLAFPELGVRPLVRVEFLTELGPEAA